MENIIVTVTNLQQSYFYDLEVPVEITIGKLKADIVEALNGYNSELMLQATSTELFGNRLGRQIRSHETMESAGVWNGDYITILEV